MRSLAPGILLGSVILASGVQAQSLAEHAAAAAGASIGTAAGKPMSNAITKIFGALDTDAQKAAKTDVKAQPKAAAPATNPARGIVSPDQPLGSAHLGSSTGRRAASAPEAQEPAVTASVPVTQPAVLYAPPAPPEPPRRDPTPEELASIQIGATEKQMIGTLGPPESKVTIPDDGHLVQICQYWANGKPVATFRLDNGQVVRVDSRVQN
jgi:hypothetical protein